MNITTHNVNLVELENEFDRHFQREMTFAVWCDIRNSIAWNDKLLDLYEVMEDYVDNLFFHPIEDLVFFEN